jgi:hypothetical protein
MKLNVLKLLSVAGAIAISAAACGKANPAQPSSTNGGSAGTSYVAPGAIQPADKATIPYANQPVFMVIANSVASSGEATFYSFEVATDSGFTHKVFTRDNLNAEQGGGVTHQAIDARLPGATTYYWHTKVTSGTSVGPFGPTFSFTLGPEITLQPPVPLSPAQDGNASGATPVLTTTNTVKSGPATAITYTFQVSDSPSFGNIVFSGTSPEGSGQTSITVTRALTPGVNYYWRVSARDASGVDSGFSSGVTFKVITFDPNAIHVFDSQYDLGSWEETAHITSVVFTDDEFDVEFDKRDGPGHWPDQGVPGFEGPLQYTLGMCAQPNKASSEWDCSGVVQFWYGRDLSNSAPPRDIALQWFYDVRWGPLQGYQPADGETVALFVGSGNLRGMSSYNRANCPGICERSDFHFTTWHNFGYYVESLRNLFKK